MAFFKARKAQLWKQFKKAIEKQIEDGFKEDKVKEEYREIIITKCTKEWKAKGYHHRDWVKTKVVFFDEDGKPQALTSDKYREM